MNVDKKVRVSRSPAMIGSTAVEDNAEREAFIWRDAKIEKPPQNSRVFCWDKDGDSFISYFYNNEFLAGDNVTHWAFIPPPK